MYELIKTLPYWLQVIILIIPIISLFIAACAFIVNVRQTILGNRLTSAKIISDCLHTFMDDDMMHEAFYKIEYSKFQYDPNIFHGSLEERKIDKLLRHFSNIALMWEKDLLTLKDIYPIQYFILRSLNDPEVEKYLSFIESWSKASSTGAHPYNALTKLKNALTEKMYT